MLLSRLQVRNEIYEKREKFQNIYGLTIVCAKFNNWKLMTCLFLLFYEDSAILC